MIYLVLPDIADEDALMRRARSGDQHAVMVIYEQYFPPIYQFIRMRTNDVATAEDLASEVFLKLVTSLRGRNAPRKSLRGWLFRVARNLLNDHYGRNEPLPIEMIADWMPDSDDQADPEFRLLQSLTADRMQDALSMLASDQQEVIVLRFGQALSLSETADIMGKSTSAIKSLQFRAVSTLRDILSQRTGGNND